MEFTEMMHAYIAAKYYVHLTEHFEKEKAEAAFLHATRYYAMQRGRRMAQRAIRDGQPLTYDTYCRYGEWVNTQTAKDMGCANRSEVQSWAPDWRVHVFVCPWHTQFKNMGLADAGALYCMDLDASICRGFNPEIDYKTEQSLHKSDYCIQRVLNSGLDVNDLPSKRPEGLKGFDYHCAHSYFAYKEVCEAIFEEEGAIVAAEVMADFRKDYGDPAAETVLSFKGTNFNAI